jgi:hypothetical protein
MKELECALNSIPKDMLKSIIQDKIKERAREILNEDTIQDMIDKLLIERMLPVLAKEVESYIVKKGKHIVNNAMDDIGTPDAVLDRISDLFEKVLLKKLK